jgi:hypothetical protein
MISICTISKVVTFLFDVSSISQQAVDQLGEVNRKESDQIAQQAIGQFPFDLIN